MTTEQYRQAAMRTCKDMGSPLMNSMHMVLGVTSEYFEALEANSLAETFTGAIEDHIKLTENVEKEFGDILWYLAGLAEFNNLELIVPHQPEFTAEKALERLNSIVKAAWVYNRSMDQPDKTGETPLVQMQDCIESLMFWISLFPFKMESLMEKNILKLAERYPDKYSDFAANNRVED